MNNPAWSASNTCTPTYSWIALCDQSFSNENECSGDESRAKVLFEKPVTTFVYTKTLNAFPNNHSIAHCYWPNTLY